MGLGCSNGRITTFAGGLGYGPAIDVAQQAVSMAAHGSTLYLVDGIRTSIEAGGWMRYQVGAA